MNKLSLAYFGTPDFSARLLEKILNDKELLVEVQLVVTQPDKKVGRKQILTPSPVKLVAQKYKLPVKTGPVASSTPPVLATKGLAARCRGPRTRATRFHDIDLVLLFAYGEIIPKDLLEIPKYGFWNVHPSLLPKYRGASPVAYPLINGDKETGVTLIQMDEKMDHGPIIIQKKVSILPKEKRSELTDRLTDIAFELFKQKVSELATEGKIDLQNQDESGVSYTKLLTKQDGYVKSEELRTKNEEEVERLFNRFRGLYPWPGLWTEIEIKGEKKRLKITEIDLSPHQKGFSAGIKKVQLEGKKEINFEQFNQIYKLF